MNPSERFAQITSEISVFLAHVLQPDETVIGLLRYGAHIPHLAARELERRGLRVPMVLSHFVKFFPPSFFSERRFLILDDSMYRGASMKQAVADLVACGVSPERIRTAAVVLHESCPSEPDEHYPRLHDPDYIEWKDELTEAVRSDVRPTERDHPLYYFSCDSDMLTAILQTSDEFGAVRSTESPSINMLKFTVVFDTTAFADDQLAGISIPTAAKIRWYCQQDERGWSLTAVPIVPTVIDITMLMSNAETVERALRFPPGFFARVRDEQIVGDWRALAYYFTNRGLAAVLLERFLCRVGKCGVAAGTQLHSVKAEVRDGQVEYMFPRMYRDVFHPAVYARLDEAIKCGSFEDACSHAARLQPPPETSFVAAQDPVLWPSTQLLVPLVAKAPPVVWGSDSWEPAEKMAGLSYDELFAAFPDKLFLSDALDELLDQGLLRAKDAPLMAHPPTFGRLFLAGGEYRAVEVYRLARAWRMQHPPPHIATLETSCA